MSIEKGSLEENKPQQIRNIEIDEVSDIDQFVEEISGLPIDEQADRVLLFVQGKLKNAIAPSTKNLPEEEKIKINEALDRSKTRKLSEVLEAGYGACVDYNVLGKVIFDKLNIPCEYKSGQAENGPKHTFLDICVNGDWQIFDPFAEVYLSDIGHPELKRFGKEYYESSNTKK